MQSNNQDNNEDILYISLFDIEKLKGMVGDKSTKPKTEQEIEEERWKHYAMFIEHLQEALANNKDNQIRQFWNDYSNTQKTESTLGWVDMKKLSQAQEEIARDRDRKHSRAFENLIVRKEPLTVNNFNIFDQLDKELPNFKEVTNFYRGAFALNQSRSIENYEAPRPVLLLGDPGIGKTHYVKKLATLLKTSYRFLDANSINGGWVLSGNNATWRGADAGLIFKEMAKSHTISPILLIDEVDKLEQREHSPFSTLHQLYEKENARAFYDEFLNLSFDASQMIHILTGNDIRNIPESLLSRFNIFYIKNPDEEAMKGIIQNIYKDIVSESKLFKAKLGKNEIEKLVKFTPREVYQILSHNIYSQAGKYFGKTGQSLCVQTNTKYEKATIGF